MDESTPLSWLRLLVLGDGTTIFQLSMVGLQETHHTFSHTTTVAEALALLDGLHYHVILLDPHQCAFQGATSVHQLRRAAPNTALLALDEPAYPLPEDAKSLCDGILVKPFGYRELEAGVDSAWKSCRRRLASAGDVHFPPPLSSARQANLVEATTYPTPSGGLIRPTRVTAGEFDLDTVRRSARLGGIELDLKETGFRLLHCLLTRAGEVVDAETLARAARARPDGQFETTMRQLSWHLHQLRQRLAAVDGDRTYIVTLRGVGYRISPEGILRNSGTAASRG